MICDAPAREVAPALLELLRWASRQTQRLLVRPQDRKSVRACFARIADCVNRFVVERPSASVADLYAQLLRGFYEGFLGALPANVTVAGARELLAFNRKTAMLPRFQFVARFLDEATAPACRSAYDAAVADSSMGRLAESGPGGAAFRRLCARTRPRHAPRGAGVRRGRLRSAGAVASFQAGEGPPGTRRRSGRRPRRRRRAPGQGARPARDAVGGVRDDLPRDRFGLPPAHAADAGGDARRRSSGPRASDPSDAPSHVGLHVRERGARCACRSTWRRRSAGARWTAASSAAAGGAPSAGRKGCCASPGRFRARAIWSAASNTTGTRRGSAACGNARRPTRSC